jgi:hypothetical protein
MIAWLVKPPIKEAYESYKSIADADMLRSFGSIAGCDSGNGFGPAADNNRSTATTCSNK